MVDIIDGKPIPNINVYTECYELWCDFGSTGTLGHDMTDAAGLFEITAFGDSSVSHSFNNLFCPFLDIPGEICGDYRRFPLKEEITWQALKKAHLLEAGNVVHFSYKIRNGVIKKSGDFSVECAYGDTTDIVLPLF